MESIDTETVACGGTPQTGGYQDGGVVRHAECYDVAITSFGGLSTLASGLALQPGLHFLCAVQTVCVCTVLQSLGVCVWGGGGG